MGGCVIKKFSPGRFPKTRLRFLAPVLNWMATEALEQSALFNEVYCTIFKSSCTHSKSTHAKEVTLKIFRKSKAGQISRNFWSVPFWSPWKCFQGDRKETKTPTYILHLSEPFKSNFWKFLGSDREVISWIWLNVLQLWGNAMEMLPYGTE